MNSTKDLTMLSFNNIQTDLHTRIEKLLTDALPSTSSQCHLAMRYSVLNGGKRLRPLLVYATGIGFNAEFTQLDAAAITIELIHCYSLVHDDLPAMDNDDLRRGKPTCHKAYNEATAILVGDALQTLAFELLAAPNDYLSATTQLQLIHILSQASGSAGMIGGQALDLEAEGKQINLEQLQTIHEKKTGALITASVMMGAIAAGCNNASELQSLKQFANLIGLAFQIKDDILDVEGDTQTLGKQSGADIANNKATYPAVLGMTKSKQALDTAYQNALAILNTLSCNTEPLQQLSAQIINRHS